jgi:S-methylmethionine-dependent homocysteine/selenocysteine methylase
MNLCKVLYYKTHLKILCKNHPLCQAWWLAFVIPAIQEAEAVGSLETKYSHPAWAA